MVYDRNLRGDGPIDDRDGRSYGAGRDYPSSNARDYGASGGYGRGDGSRGREGGDQGYGRSDPSVRYDRDQPAHGRPEYGSRDHGRQEQGRSDPRGGRDWRGDYGGDGRYFEDGRRYRNADDDRDGRYQSQDRGGYGRQPQGYDHDDRGFFQRAGDEVRSWFGDDEAERRREADARYEEHDDRSGRGRHDDDYRQWRSNQVSQLDRDYHEYRQENRSKFENEFSSWRTTRQGQRDQLRNVQEHAEVVGSDGAHIGTVDKIRDDRILLTKTDKDAGGHHHSIPSRWIVSAEDKTVTLSKTAAEAKAAWEDDDRESARVGYGDNQAQDRGYTRDSGRDAQGRILNRSFRGTY